MRSDVHSGVHSDVLTALCECARPPIRSELSGLHTELDGVRQMQDTQQRASNELATVKGQVASLQHMQEQAHRTATEGAFTQSELTRLSGTFASTIGEVKAKLVVLEAEIQQGDRAQSVELKSTISRMEMEMKHVIEDANSNASRAINDLQATRQHTEEEIARVKDELMQEKVDDQMMEANLKTITQKMEVLSQLVRPAAPPPRRPACRAPPEHSKLTVALVIAGHLIDAGRPTARAADVREVAAAAAPDLVLPVPRAAATALVWRRRDECARGRWLGDGRARDSDPPDRHTQAREGDPSGAGPGGPRGR